MGLIFFGLILVLILLRKQKNIRFVRFLLWFMVILLFLGGNPWIEGLLVHSLEWQYFPPENLPEGSVVVVLGGGTESNQPPRPMAEINGAGDRVLYAAKLYHTGVAKNLLLSGGTISWYGDRMTTPAMDMLQILALTGVPSEACWLQTQSQNTYEDALYSAELLKEQGIEEIILVTSAAHMPRSVALFEKQGLTVIPAPTDYNLTEAAWTSLWHPTWQTLLTGLIPKANYLSSNTSILKEYLGMLMYSLRGWM